MNQKEFLKSGNYLVSEIQIRAEKNHSHFFDKDTMRFFSSRISELCWKKGNDIYFITSEADKSQYKHKGSVRSFTVRKCDINGEIDKVSEFQEYETLAQARNAIKRGIEN